MDSHDRYRGRSGWRWRAAGRGSVRTLPADHPGRHAAGCKHGNAASCSTSCARSDACCRHNTLLATGGTSAASGNATGRSVSANVGRLRSWRCPASGSTPGTDLRATSTCLRSATATSVRGSSANIHSTSSGLRPHDCLRTVASLCTESNVWSNGRARPYLSVRGLPTELSGADH